MRVLLTGAAGFIGLGVLKALVSARHSVVTVDNLSRGVNDEEYKRVIAEPNVTPKILDLADADSWNSLEGQFDRVIHLAAINGTKHFYERPFEVMSTNTQIVTNLIKWHHKTNSQARIVFTSSSEAYAGVPDTPIPTPENVTLGVDNIENPRWSYGISKIAGEALIRGYQTQHGCKFTIIRPHNVYGPRMGDDHVIPEFVQRIKSDDSPFKIFGGNNTRAFCYIDDFVDGLLLASESEKAENSTFNLGDDSEEISMTDLADRLFAIAGVSPLADVEAAPGGSVLRRCPDLTRAKEILGYSPKISFDQGLEITYNWYAGRAAD
jgi:nucleoside-diphosphate-sugar epimerase